MTSDELKSMQKGQFVVVMKTGFHAMKVKMKLFFQWGIRFDENNPYIVKERGKRKIQYVEQSDIRIGIMRRYHSEILLMEKFYEDVEAEMKDATDEADVHPELQKRKLSQSRKGTVRTIPKRRNGRGAKQVITDAEEERSVKKQDEET